MNRLCCYQRIPLIVGPLGIVFLSACFASAQEAKTFRDLVTPVQAQESAYVQAALDEGANLSALKNWAIAFWDSADDMLGANLQPVGDALRTQLDIQAGQGLVVEGLRGGGACAQVGLQQNDILLSLADKPLGSVGDLIKQLKAAGDSPVPLKILRGGKPVAIKVRPIYRVTIGPVGEQKTEYYIGISVVGPNDAMRAQLGLLDKGMVVSEVEKGSPADKAGVKKWDIVLLLEGKTIDSPEALQRQVQAAQDRSAILKIIRAGKPMDISVVAATRKVEVPPNADAAYRLLLLNRPEGEILRLTDVARLGLANTDQLLSPPVNTTQPALGTVIATQSALNMVPIQSGAVDANDLRQRLDQLEKELASVRAALDKINETLKAKNGTKRD
jgi:membrane-associated protease RseP (regulator of RpoE activity)